MHFFYCVPVLTFFVWDGPYNRDMGVRTMTVVYVDSLFLLNLIVNYLLLLATGKLAAEWLRRWRLLAGAAAGALYAAAVFFPGMGFLLHPFCKGAVAVGMVLIAYGGSRRLLRLLLIFFGVSAAFGGGVLAIELFGGRGLTLENGIYYSMMDVKLLLVSAAACYLVLSLVFRRLGQHGGKRGELLPATIRLLGKSVQLTALVDTGNTLTDPMNGRPIMVAEGERLATLFSPEEFPARGELLSPVTAMERLSRGSLRGRLRLVPYQTVGVECGLLLAVRTDRVCVAGKDCEGLLVALSPNKLSDGGAYSALVGTM